MNHQLIELLQQVIDELSEEDIMDCEVEELDPESDIKFYDKS